jgi:hypothetical protein
MRVIRIGQIAAFAALLGIAAAAAIATTWLLDRHAFLGDFRGVVLVVVALALLYVYAIVVHRVFLRVWPLRAGEISPGSAQESVYHVYLLFYLVLFHTLLRSGIVPVPLLRLLYLALGARWGAHTYTSGIVFDPTFVQVGRNTILGQSSLVIPHVIEGDRLAHYPVHIGDNVTVGAHAVILCDVVIGNDTMIASGAVVGKGTRIGDGEVWAGVPARRVERDRDGRADATRARIA